MFLNTSEERSDYELFIGPRDKEESSLLSNPFRNSEILLLEKSTKKLQKCMSLKSQRPEFIITKGQEPSFNYNCHS